MTTIGFIGGGQMAEALIKGMVEAKVALAPEISISDPDPARIQYFRDLKKSHFKALIIKRKITINIAPNNRQNAGASEIVLLAVKPQHIQKVTEEIKDVMDSKKLVISIAAGASIASLEKVFPDVPIIRAMPNNPALVMAGITALAGGTKVSSTQLDMAKEIFSSVGRVVEVEEKLMDAVTGLSGSGPAYVYLFFEFLVEAFTGAGVKLGINEVVSKRLADATVFGAVKTLADSKKTAKELRQMVTSPGGTTEEGIKVLKEKDFQRKLNEIMARAVEAAAKKAEALLKKA